jgi:hypothetical protein
MAFKFDHPNEPNASRLIESLRCLGYDNYVALADIVDNSFDAECDTIKISIWVEEGNVRIMVADNGKGMDYETLDEALKLGSLTLKNPVSDLGKFGMGLVTAGLSLARQTRVITKHDNLYITSIVDVDEVISRNTFCKYLGESGKDDKKFIDDVFPESETGTIVIFDKCDGIRNKNTTVFANTLRKHLGRVHRYFLGAGKQIVINNEAASIIDPLEINDPNTEIFSDDEYPITLKQDGVERHENIRVRITLIPENYAGGEREIGANIKNQGFYILRNNREIKAAETLDAFTRHNDFNRMRGEIFFNGALDNVVGIDFTKRDIVLDQSLKDQLLKHLKAQCTTIKRQESSKSKVKGDPEISIFHEQAEKIIDQKAKLLIMPKTEIEKRQRLNEETPKKDRTREKPEKTRRNFDEAQRGIASRCKFEYAKLGPHGQIYECELHGRTVVIRWNIEHPFYQRFVLDQRSDGRLVTAVDYFVYSMATAELTTISDDNVDLVNNFKAIISSNMRTLLV